MKHNSQFSHFRLLEAKGAEELSVRKGSSWVHPPVKDEELLLSLTRRRQQVKHSIRNTIHCNY
jgi:hypothetical protein